MHGVRLRPRLRSTIIPLPSDVHDVCIIICSTQFWNLVLSFVYLPIYNYSWTPIYLRQIYRRSIYRNLYLPRGYTSPEIFWREGINVSPLCSSCLANYRRPGPCSFMSGLGAKRTGDCGMCTNKWLTGLGWEKEVLEKLLFPKKESSDLFNWHTCYHHSGNQCQGTCTRLLWNEINLSTSISL